MAMTLLALLLATAAVTWFRAAAKPQPVRARRNSLPEELPAAYRSDARRCW